MTRLVSCKPISMMVCIFCLSRKNVNSVSVFNFLRLQIVHHPLWCNSFVGTGHELEHLSILGAFFGFSVWRNLVSFLRISFHRVFSCLLTAVSMQETIHCLPVKIFVMCWFMGSGLNMPLVPLQEKVHKLFFPNPISIREAERESKISALWDRTKRIGRSLTELTKKLLMGDTRPYMLEWLGQAMDRNRFRATIQVSYLQPCSKTFCDPSHYTSLSLSTPPLPHYCECNS